MKAGENIFPEEEILSFRGVSVAVPPPYDVGLEDVNLVVKRGELALISMERGNGISPFADAAQGLIIPSKGGVYFLGKKWSELDPRSAAAERHRIGRVFPEGGWVSNLNIDENITLGQRHHTNLPSEEIYRAAEQIGVSFGLPSIPSSRPAHARKSILRKAGWIRAFLGQPELILLEEPLKNSYTDDLHYLMKGIAGVLSRGGAVIWITSDFRFIDQNQLSPFKIYQMTGSKLSPLRLQSEEKGSEERD